MPAPPQKIVISQLASAHAMNNADSYSKKEREYLGRIEARVEILRARLATTNLPDPQEITKELHSLEWVLQQCSRGPSSDVERFVKALSLIALTADEDNEWDAVDKFRGCREIAMKALNWSDATPQGIQEKP
jgi:hypothetical protein